MADDKISRSTQQEISSAASRSETQHEETSLGTILKSLSWFILIPGAVLLLLKWFLQL